MAYEVRTEAFAGPLDVLVKLVAAQEVDIWEVSLTRLVDDFLAVMLQAGQPEAVRGPVACDASASVENQGEPQACEQAGSASAATGPSATSSLPSEQACRTVAGDAVAGGGRIDMEVASEFALLAATLIELKSRRLLPEPTVELDLEEELAAYGLRDAAFARLVEGRTFGAAARLLRERWNTAALRWPRTAGPEERFVAAAPDLLEGACRDDLAAALERVLAPRPVPRVDVSHLRAAGITVDEAAVLIVERLAVVGGAATFREITEPLTERVVVVVYFLAVLELFGSGLVELTQAERFGEIGVQWIGDSAASAAEALSEAAGAYGEDAA